MAYKQDSQGRIIEITETIQGQTRKFNYVYDSAGRLSEMSRNDTLLAIYEYDAKGNRLSHYTPGATITATYDSQDRLLTYGNASYSYTRNGELLTKYENIYYSVMTTINQLMSQQLSLLRRALLGALVGAFLGALELWFFEFDLPHFCAAVGAGATFMSILAIVVGQLQHRRFKLFLAGGFSGSMAGMVWWVIANQTVEWLWVAVCIGMFLGVLYVWMEEIVPFRCEKCGTKFDLYGGGLCSVCKRFFCSSHLDEIRVGKSRNPICIDCKKAQEKVC